MSGFRAATLLGLALALVPPGIAAVGGWEIQVFVSIMDEPAWSLWAANYPPGASPIPVQIAFGIAHPGVLVAQRAVPGTWGMNVAAALGAVLLVNWVFYSSIIWGVLGLHRRSRRVGD